MRSRTPSEPPGLPADLWWASRVLVPLLIVLGLPPRLADLVGLVDLPGPWWALSLVSPTALAWLTWRIRKERGWRGAWAALRVTMRITGAFTLALVLLILLWFGR